MNEQLNKTKLNKYIIEKIRENIGYKLEKYFYYDVCEIKYLSTNNNGIDIISNQLELIFENNNQIFLSWDTIDGWLQYSLCVSDKSFCDGVEKFQKNDKNWDNIIGEKLIDFQVYGFLENVITITDTISENKIQNTYFNEPHLLVLKFDNNKSLGVANFYLEDDFIPKLPMGDDIWIIFNIENINNCIKALNLEKLSENN